MLVIFGILLVVTSIVLGLIVLIQNPKGGGLSGTFGGFSNQLMGVKQTTDVLEKGTWIFAAVLGILCMVSPAFIPKGTASIQNNKTIEDLSIPKNQTAPAGGIQPVQPTTPPATTPPPTKP